MIWHYMKKIIKLCIRSVKILQVFIKVSYNYNVLNLEIVNNSCIYLEIQ